MSKISLLLLALLALLATATALQGPGFCTCNNNFGKDVKTCESADCFNLCQQQGGQRSCQTKNKRAMFSSTPAVRPAMQALAIPCDKCNAELTEKGVPADDAAKICAKLIKCQPAVATVQESTPAMPAFRVNGASVRTSVQRRTLVAKYAAAKFTDCSATGHLATLTGAEHDPSPPAKGTNTLISALATLPNAIGASTSSVELTFGAGEVVFTDTFPIATLPAGDVYVDFDFDIPANAPAGTYTFKETLVVDATKEQVFCMSTSFTL